MDGIQDPYELNLNYLWQLVQEYTVLNTSQLYLLLKKHGNIGKNNRNRIMRELAGQWRVNTFSIEKEHYYASSPKSRLTERYEKQIACFSVLLDYFDKIESHYATGTFTRISMIISGFDYSIVYVSRGEERLCVKNMENSGTTRFIVVVEDIRQIPQICHEKIRAFATVSAKGTVTYYENKGEITA